MSKLAETGACKTLQSNNKHSSDVGKSKKSLLDYFHPRYALRPIGEGRRYSENDCKKKVSKSTQVSSTWIIEEDISSDMPSEHFWQSLAEKRRIALEDALGENERLCKLYESLEIENGRYQTLLDEANCFVEVFKEVVQTNADDTGIEIGDLSTSTETEG